MRINIINHNILIKRVFKYKLKSAADHPLLRTFRNVENLQTLYRNMPLKGQKKIRTFSHQ